MKALVEAFNQEKALVGAFSVIVKTDGSFAALTAALQQRTVGVWRLLIMCVVSVGTPSVPRQGGGLWGVAI